MDPAIAPAARVPAGALPDVTRREAGLAILAVALAATLFLGGALFTGRVLSPADLLFSFPPWQAQAPAGWSGPSNPVLSDSVLQYEPWDGYLAARLRAGALPLWNPDNMLGAPFLGNMQSAVFYPGTWLYVLFPGPGTLAVMAWLKLVVAGLGMYLLARQVGRVGPVAASVAAGTWMFSSFMTVWLLYTLASVACWLPLAWWLTARLWARPGPGAAAGLAAVAALTLVAGHPETAYYVALSSGLFALFLLATQRPWRTRGAVGRLALWGGAYALGAAIAAIQLAPFLEYLGQGAALVRREAVASTGFWLPFRYAWTLATPNLFGDTARGTWWDTGSNYSEVNAYVGALPLVLALLAFATRDRARRLLAGFLVVLGLLAAGGAFHWVGIAPLLAALPFQAGAANQRLILLIEFALALLAALGAETLLTAPAPRRRLALGFAASVAGAVALAVGVPLLLGAHWFRVPAGDAAALATWRGALARAGIALAAAGAIGALVLVRRRLPGRAVAGAALLLPLFAGADLWQAHADFNPTIAADAYFPATATTTWLQGRPGTFRSTAPGWILMPNTNLVYGLSVLGGYDFVMPGSYYELIAQIDPQLQQFTTGGFTPFDQLRSPLLNLLNVRYLLMPPGRDPNYVADIVQEQSSGAVVGPIAARNRPGQTFLSNVDNLARIDVLGATYTKALTGTITFHLQTDPPGPTDLVTRQLDVSTLADNGYWTITFPPIAGSYRKHYYFYFDAPQRRPEDAPTLWYDKANVYPIGSRFAGGKAVAGDLAFRTYALPEPAGSWFAQADTPGGGLTIFTNRRALPRAWLAHRVQVAPDAAARPARSWPARPFDAAGTALLDAPLPAADTLPATPPLTATDQVSITAYAPEQVTIATNSPAAGVLVLADQAFPGWEATVDGQAAPIVTADHALRGVYLPAGAHTVVFTYAPNSVRLGAAGSALGLLVLAGLIAVPRLRRRSEVR